MKYLLVLILSIARATPCDLRNKPHLNRITENSNSIIHIVNGQRVAYQDGPNCYNAALFGKGYVSELTFVDPTEFAFYINKFCSPSTHQESPGDIIALKYSDDSFEHAALAIEGGLIFEKDSTWGKYSPSSETHFESTESPAEKARVIQERADSSLYKIKTKKQSKYFGNFRKQLETPQFQVYKCRDSKNIEADLISLSHIPGVKEILAANKKIEALVFSEKQERWQEDLASDIAAAAKAAMESSASGDDGLFLLTKVISLEGQLHHLSGTGMAPDKSYSAKFNDAFRELKTAREMLEAKQRQNKSELAKMVFRAL